MNNLTKALDEYSADIEAVQKFCDEIYNEHFSSNFKKVRELYQRMKSDIHPITDEELEYILTTFPLELFVISEQLNKIRLNSEVVKLKNKETIEKLRNDAIAEATAQGLNKTQTNEYVSHVLNRSMVEYEVLLSAYNSIITRVENEQTFSKELIMGAKKVWDARRNTDLTNPVGEVVPELPEYNIKSGKTPVYGS